MHSACMHAASAACSCFSMHTLAAHDHVQGSCWMATGCSKGLATTRQLTRRACLPACCHLGDQGSRSDRRRHRRRRERAPQERCRPGRRQKPARQPEPAIAGCSLCRGTFSAWGKPNWGRGSNAKCLGAVPGKQEAVKPCFVWSHNEGKAVTRPAETRYRADDCHPSPQGAGLGPACMAKRDSISTAIQPGTLLWLRRIGAEGRPPPPRGAQAGLQSWRQWRWRCSGGGGAEDHLGSAAAFNL